MDFTPSDKKRYKDLLLQTYKVFAKFCADNGISYFAAGGTLIGAVRHHGFIPWDDDVDVYMKRADYDKFISLRDQLANTAYEIIDPSNNGYYCAMAKFSHRYSTTDNSPSPERGSWHPRLSSGSIAIMQGILFFS